MPKSFEIIENADIKLLISQAKFQSDQDYFRCPVIPRGPPISYFKKGHYDWGEAKK